MLPSDAHLNIAVRKLQGRSQSSRDGIDAYDFTVGFIVDDGLAATILFHRIRCASELPSVDGGNNLFSQGVVFNKLLVDWIRNQNVAIGYVEAVSPNPRSSKHRYGHGGDYENRRDEFGQAALAAVSEKISADLLGSSSQRGFRSGGHFS